MGKHAYIATITGLLATIAAVSEANIIQSGDLVLFEAEIATIDNSFDDPTKGWIEENAAGASGGVNLVSDEDHSTLTNPPANNSLTYSINFNKIGSYRVWVRAQASTRNDLEDNRTSTGNNDSFYLESGTIGNQSSFSEENSIGVSSSSWSWLNRETVTVAATGLTTWAIGNREDGTMVDRFVFQHTEDTTGSATFDGLANSTVVPEPGTQALLAAGLLVLIRLRQRLAVRTAA